MAIREEIFQTRPFDTIHDEALVNILFTYGWLMERSRAILKPHGITPTQYNILRILKGAGQPISTSDIRNRMLDKNSDASRAVDRLVKKGWVLKKTCPNDRRLIDVELSDEGLKLMESLGGVREATRALIKNLTEKEANVLSKTLDKIRQQ